MFEPESENTPSAPNLYSGLSVDLSALQQAEANVPDQWQVGQSIVDLYNVEADIGQGGFGQVYKVLHTGWNISLAVKTPKVDKLTEKEVENFIREAETWVKLGLHPHIVTCFYVRKLGKSPRVFAEFVGGGSLHDWIYSKEGEIPRLYQGGQAESFRRILDIAIQFAWGLHYSHEQGLIHQDVKPGNTMMTADGTVKVTDFGLARGKPVVVSVTEALPDQTLQVEGSGSTPAYRSPEQARGDNLTRRTDLYSWALSVLEMFKGGRRWRTGEMVTQERQFYLNLEPEHDYIPPMGESVAQLLWVCLREDSERRPRTMLDVANTLKVIYQQETGEVYPRPEPETGKDIADSLNNRAVSLLDLGQVEEAMHLWDKALEVNPLHPESTYNRGLILWRACRITDDILVKDLEKVRDANIENWNAHYLLALVHLERNNCEEAIKSLNQIPADQVQQSEVQEALRLAQEKLPNSNRFEKELIDWDIDLPIRSVGITSDAKYGLSISYISIENITKNESKLYVWDLKSGRVYKSFTMEGLCLLTSISVSSDSYYVLVNGAINGSQDQLWDINQGYIREFKEEGKSYESSSIGHLSVNGQLVIFGNKNGTIELWDIKTREIRGNFTRHEGKVNSIASILEGNFILSGSDDKTLKLWDVENGNCLQTFAGHTEAVQSVCLSADGKFAISGSSDNTLKLWDTSTGKCLKTFIGHTNSVQSVCFSPDGKFALSGSLDATLRLWDVATGRCLHTFIGHEKAIFSICLSANGRTALSGSADTTIRMWSVGYPSTAYFGSIRLCQVIETEKIIATNQAYEQELAAAQIAFSQGDMLAYGQHIATVRSLPGYDKSKELFTAWTSIYQYFPKLSLRSAWEGETFLEHTSRVTSICFSFDGKSVLSSSGDGKILLWDIESRQIIQRFEGHEAGDTVAYLSRDARYILSGNWNDKMLKLWNVETGRCIRNFEGHTDGITSICWTSDTHFALSGSLDGTIRLWDVQTGRCLRVNKGHGNKVYHLCLSPDEQYYLSAKRQIKIWKLSRNSYLSSYSKNNLVDIYSMQMSLDMKYILVAGDYENFQLLTTKTGVVREFKGHTKKVFSVCFSPDGEYALSGSVDNTARLWDVKTAKCLRIFEGHIDSIRSVCFSPDMKYVLSGSWNGEIKVWFLDWQLRKCEKEDDQKIQTYLVNFLALSTPYVASLPTDTKPSEEEITKALTRDAKSKSDEEWKDAISLSLGKSLDQDFLTRIENRIFWSEQEFQNLLITLSFAGYGSIKPNDIKARLLSLLIINPLNLLFHFSSPFEHYVKVREDINTLLIRGAICITTIYVLTNYLSLSLILSIIIAIITSFVFTILSFPIAIFVAPILIGLQELYSWLQPYIIKIFKSLGGLYKLFANDLFLQTSFLCFYALIFYTMIDLWNLAYWRAFFISLIPAMILSDQMDKLLGGKNVKYEENRLLFWLSYMLVMVILKHFFHLGWVISYWLSIPLAIVFTISFWKIFYKLVKPTRKD